jgi:hemolysin activation/secretion protein
MAHGQAVQPSPASVVEEGLRRQNERDKAQQDALTPHADVLRPATAGTAVPELPDERPCFVIHDIAVQGKDAWRLKWLGASTDAFVGRCVGIQGVARIAAFLNAQLIEQGYVTSRVGVGPQNLAEGRLAFELFAGRIAEVRMVDAETKAPDTRWGTWVNAFPTTAGRLLDARALEQGVEQMKRVPSQNVSTTLAPGAAPDTSILTIERQSAALKDRVRGGVTLDNSGSPTLGRTQFSTNVALDNLLGLSDIASLSVNGNAENPDTAHRSQSASINYSIPFGYSSFSASLSHSRYAQKVALTSTSVLNSGASDTADFKWEHVVWRTASTKSGVYADLSTRKSRSYLDDSENTQARRQTTFIETGVSFKQLLAGNASLEGSLGYRRGVPWLDAQDDLVPEAGLTVRPQLWVVNASAAVPFKQPAVDGWPERSWQYTATLHGQFTHDATTSIDQIAIGNRGTVRGFDGDNVLLAESGWTLRNELSTPLAFGAADASFYAGLDWGRVWGPSGSDLLGHFMAGAAMGVRGKWKAVQFDLALAAPLAMPEGFKTARLASYLSATYAF